MLEKITIIKLHVINIFPKPLHLCKGLCLLLVLQCSVTFLYRLLIINYSLKVASRNKINIPNKYSYLQKK